MTLSLTLIVARQMSRRKQFSRPTRRHSSASVIVPSRALCVAGAAGRRSGGGQISATAVLRTRNCASGRVSRERTSPWPAASAASRPSMWTPMPRKSSRRCPGALPHCNVARPRLKGFALLCRHADGAQPPRNIFPADDAQKAPLIEIMGVGRSITAHP